MLDPRTALSEEIQRHDQAMREERRIHDRKRMRFEAAVAAMQGIRATFPVGRADYEYVAKQAVGQADALLKELGL